MYKQTPNSLLNNFSPLNMVEGSGRYIEKPINENCQTLLAIWESKKKANEIPNRIDIQPTDLKSILPYFYLIESINDGEDFKVRLIGTACSAILNKDITNQTIKTSGLPDIEFRKKVYKKVLETRQPAFFQFETKKIQKNQFDYDFYNKEVCAFPLLDKNNNATLLACCIGLNQKEFKDIS
jgi:hypothetical protein